MFSGKHNRCKVGAGHLTVMISRPRLSQNREAYVTQLSCQAQFDMRPFWTQLRVVAQAVHPQHLICRRQAGWGLAPFGHVLKILLLRIAQL